MKVNILHKLKMQGTKRKSYSLYILYKLGKEVIVVVGFSLLIVALGFVINEQFMLTSIFQRSILTIVKLLFLTRFSHFL